MVSWVEELERRETAVRDRIPELRGQIEELTDLLIEQEGVVSRLEITRETMSEIFTAPHRHSNRLERSSERPSYIGADSADVNRPSRATPASAATLRPLSVMV